MSEHIDFENRYSATQNNGKITQMKDWISGEEVNYLYDLLQRLSSATTTGRERGLNFADDDFGNRASQSVTKGAAPTAIFSYDLVLTGVPFVISIAAISHIVDWTRKSTIRIAPAQSPFEVLAANRSQEIA